MKSTKNEGTPFSMEDFEKGLMLAGLSARTPFLKSMKELNWRIMKSN